MSEATMADYDFVPDDKHLADALDTAQRIATEADAKFCAAFGGDGETSAYWLTAAIAEIRAALARSVRARTEMTDAEFVALYREHWPTDVPDDHLLGYEGELLAFARAARRGAQ